MQQKEIINIRFLIAYDGTRYQGWQKGSEGKTVEEAIEKILSRIYQHPITLQAASRTDAGVHAKGQVVNFLAPKETDLNKLIYSLNRLLPTDIFAREIEQAPDAFHPSLDAIAKEYRYYICNEQIQLPFHRLYSWHVYEELNFKAIEEGINFLCGKHDFSSFCNHKPSHRYEHFIREIFSIERVIIEEEGKNRFYFTLKGDSFLYRMARNIVGTLIDVGLEKISPSDLNYILNAKDRKLAGISAPAHGLFLQRVFY